MKLHHRLANAFGYELIKLRKLNDTLDQNLKNIFRMKKIDCVIDVGANIGQYAQSLRNIGFAGRIISFEPVRNTYAALEDNSANDSDWWTYQLALGASHSTQSINVCKSSDFSSFRSPSEFATERFTRKVETLDREEVNVNTLDSMWPDLIKDLKNPRVYLKLDTQGFDLEVLKGAENSIRYVLGMQSEVSMKAVYDGMPDYLTALAEFRNLGFEIAGLYPVSRDKNSLAVIEYDCLLVKPPDSA